MTRRDVKTAIGLGCLAFAGGAAILGVGGAGARALDAHAQNGGGMATTSPAATATAARTGTTTTGPARPSPPSTPAFGTGAIAYTGVTGNRSRIVPHANTPQDILERIAARARGGRVKAARVRGAPTDVSPTEDPNAPVPEWWRIGKWIDVTMAVAELEPAAAARAMWEANLIVGAVRDEMHAAGLPPVVGSEIYVALPDGAEVRIGGGIGNVQEGQQFDDAPPAEVEASVRSAATRAGFTVRSVDVLTARQPAPAMTVTTDDPALTVLHADVFLDHIFGRTKYEGIYFEVRDRDGGLVFIQGSSYRTGVGQRWIRPDLDPRRDPEGP